MKIFLRFLLFASLVFLFVYLYTNGLLAIPELDSPGLFLISVILVLFGFLLDGKAWQVIIRTEIPGLSLKEALISAGKFIFSKYIPGKFWIVAGRAGYIKEKYNGNMIHLTSFSFYYQLIVIFAGTLTGFLVLRFINIFLFWILVAVITSFIIFFLVFYKKTIRLVSKTLKYILRKDIALPLIPSQVTLQLIMISVANWLIWSIAFYLFLLSVNGNEMLHLKFALLFPVSTVLGIIVIFAPGGIGIREGFLTIGLTAMGMQAKEAASVAVVSRVWFLAGEFLFFVSAWVLQFGKAFNRKNP